MIEVIKIQLPIITSETTPLAYCYNEARTISLFLPIESVIGYFNKDELKIYVLAEITPDGMEIIRKVQWRNW